MNSIEKNISKILSVDALDEAEKITGKSYKEDEKTSLLGLSLLTENVKDKEAMLSLAGDVYFHIDIQKYIDIVEKNGFCKIYCLPFVVLYYDKTYTENFYCYWKNGILLVFESYHSKIINSSNFYYNWVPHDKDYKGEGDKHFSGCYEEYNENLVRVGYKDGREALIHNITIMERDGEFLDTWIKRPFLWLLNYQEKSKGVDKINDDKIARFPEDIRNKISP